MNIDLLSVFENNKEIENKQKELNKEKELMELITYIIQGRETFKTDNKELLEEIGIKYKKIDNFGYMPFIRGGQYEIKLNKTNIKKIQNYIDMEEK